MRMNGTTDMPGEADVRPDAALPWKPWAVYIGGRYSTSHRTRESAQREATAINIRARLARERMGDHGTA